MYVVLTIAAMLSAPLGASIRVAGTSYKLTHGFDLAMCKAVVAEMVTEVQKHDLKQNGEEDIFDTAGMAICLGVVKNYAMDARKSGKWGLRKKTQPEKEAEEEGHIGDMTAMLLLKEACFAFADELQQEISETIYKHVSVKSAEQLGNDFCPRATEDKKKKKKKKKPSKKPVQTDPEQAERAQYEKFMNGMGGDGSMYDIIKQDRDSPEETLTDDDQAEITTASKALQCRICTTAVSLAYKQSGSRTDEAVASEAVQRAFFGLADDESMDYKPGNPPDWSQDYVVTRGKKTGDFQLKHSPVKSEQLPYTDRIKRNVVIAQACRRSFSLTDDDLGEMLVLHAAWSPEQLGAVFCKPVCGAPHDEL